MTRLLALIVLSLLGLWPAVLSAALPEGVTVDGGCPPEASPYLPYDPALKVAQITYCAGGDGWTGTARLRVPARLLADHDIVIAGYPDEPGVTVSLRQNDELVGVSAPRASERWLLLPLNDAMRVGDGVVIVEVEDQSSGTFGWAGVGLVSRQAVPAAPPMTVPAAGVAAALLFAALLFYAWRRRPASAVTPRRANAPVVAMALGLLTVLTLLFRRPSQFQHPALWVEEGTVSLPQFLDSGLGFLFEPVAGYLILPSKLLFYLATFAPPEAFPVALLVLSALFTWGVVCAISLCPSHLHASVPVAAFLLVLPTDAENYATAHYAFWFGSALLVPALFWKNGERPWHWGRGALVVLGGLSSPLVIALLPAFLLRLVLFRTRDEAVQTVLVVAAAAIQAAFLATSGTHGAGPPPSLELDLLVSKFFGLFWAPVDDLALPFGLLLAAGVALAIFRFHRSSPWLMLAGYCLAATILISVARAPLEAIHPALAGPRYFFYPYFFLGMILIEAGAGSRWIAAGCMVVMLGCLVRFVDVGSRSHDPLEWASELRACARAKGDYSVPVHFDGDVASAWGVTLASGDCRRILDGWK